MSITIKLNRGNSMKKLLLSAKNQSLNGYIVETPDNVFLYTESAIQNRSSEQLLKKVIPYLEDEFFCHN